MNIDLKGLVRRGVSWLQEGIQFTNAVVKDKGFNRFGRTFLAGSAFMFAAYALIYSPSANRLAMVGRRIAQARAESEAASSYESLSQSLAQVYAQLPSNQDPADWLGNSVSNCLKQVGVTATSITPGSSNGASSDDFLNDASLNVTATMKYVQLLGVLRRLESLRPRVRVSSISLKKGGSPIGSNTVVLDIETLAPQQRFTP